MRLTGNEPWVVAGLQGEDVYARRWGDRNWWWPIVFVELDCGLIKVDVCGKTESWNLDNCAQLRIGSNVYVENEDIFGTEGQCDPRVDSQKES